MYLSNTTYDRAKWIILVLLPALGVLIRGMGEVYPHLQVDQVIATLNLVTAFLGTLLQISSKQYHDNHPGNGGLSMISPVKEVL